MRIVSLFLCVSLLAVTACGASFPKPEARVSSSEAAVRGAEEAGAKTNPRATLHLKLAQEGRTKALALIEAEKYKEADLVLQRAEADAELAIALSREGAANAEAEKTLEQVNALKKKAAQ
jgi:hypothetical protein